MFYNLPYNPKSSTINMHIHRFRDYYHIFKLNIKLSLRKIRTSSYGLFHLQKCLCAFDGALRLLPYVAATIFCRYIFVHNTQTHTTTYTYLYSQRTHTNTVPVCIYILHIICMYVRICIYFCLGVISFCLLKN